MSAVETIVVSIIYNKSFGARISLEKEEGGQ
jgi:hypothetical protein